MYEFLYLRSVHGYGLCENRHLPLLRLRCVRRFWVDSDNTGLHVLLVVICANNGKREYREAVDVTIAFSVVNCVTTSQTEAIK